MLATNLARVRERVLLACERCRRDPRAITLIGVTKTVDPARVREAVGLGVADVGENRVQEAAAKIDALGPLSGVRWHLIGHLQTNKAKAAVGLFEVIHSVDSAKLLEALEREAAAQRRRPRVLIQVNVSGEASKSGCRPEEAEALAASAARAAHLELEGFMTIPPLAQDPEAARPSFRTLRELRDRIQAVLDAGVTGEPAHRPTRLQLSMGMSHDFEIAIEEGADYIRVGTALFGAR